VIAVGLDRARGRWVAVALRFGRVEAAEVHPDAGSVVARWPRAAAFAVDAPIGPGETLGRRSEVEARRTLGERWASVFLTPPAALLALDDYAAANRRAKALYGQGISRQAWGLRAAILDVGAVAAADSRWHETHPELAFQELAGRALASKRSESGKAERRALLASMGIALPGSLPGAATHDVLDAGICAWVAHRIAVGSASSLPADPRPGDGKIWY
jgi:predicted RNase H-like nuclease